MSEKELKMKQQALLADLADICMELNWVIGIPKEAMTEGLICGTMKYVEDSCLKTYGKDNYEIVDQRSAQKELDQPATSDNKGEFDVVELTEDQFNEFLATGELPEDVKLIGEPDKGITYH